MFENVHVPSWLFSFVEVGAISLSEAYLAIHIASLNALPEGGRARYHDSALARSFNIPRRKIRRWTNRLIALGIVTLDWAEGNDTWGGMILTAQFDKRPSIGPYV